MLDLAINITLNRSLVTIVLILFADMLLKGNV